MIKNFETIIYIDKTDFNKMNDFFNNKSNRVLMEKTIEFGSYTGTYSDGSWLEHVCYLKIQGMGEFLRLTISDSRHEEFYRNSKIYFKRNIYYIDDLLKTFTFEMKKDLDEIKLDFSIEKNWINNQLYNEGYFRKKFDVDDLYSHLIKKPIDVYSVVYYLDFKEENQLAFATYSMFVYPKKLKNEDKTFHLYERKLYFYGYELEDFFDKIKKFEVTKIDETLDKMTKKEILKLLFNYLAYVKFSDEKRPERTDTRTIHKISSKIYNKYSYS